MNIMDDLMSGPISPPKPIDPLAALMELNSASGATKLLTQNNILGALASLNIATIANAPAHRPSVPKVDPLSSLTGFSGMGFGAGPAVRNSALTFPKAQLVNPDANAGLAVDCTFARRCGSVYHNF